MPLWLRNWTFKEISDYYKEQSDAQKNTMQPKNTLVNSDGKINTKQFMEASKPYTKSSYK